MAGVTALKTGIYSISASGRKVIDIGVSLLDRMETSLSGINKIKFNERLFVDVKRKKVKSAESLWKFLALAALAILIIEWWYFNRKPGI